MTFEPKTEPTKEPRTDENTEIWRNGAVGADAHKDDQRQRNDSLDTVLASFNWFAQAAQIQVKSLGEDLKKSDEPDMVHRCS
jgi:hypothetical protein